jgi:hypothetical protein
MDNRINIGRLMFPYGNEQSSVRWSNNDSN